VGVGVDLTVICALEKISPPVEKSSKTVCQDKKIHTTIRRRKKWGGKTTQKEPIITRPTETATRVQEHGGGVSKPKKKKDLRTAIRSKLESQKREGKRKIGTASCWLDDGENRRIRRVMRVHVRYSKKC